MIDAKAEAALFPHVGALLPGAFPDGSSTESICSVYGDPRPLLNGRHSLSVADDIRWREHILSPAAVPFPRPVQLFGAESGAPATRVYVHRLLFESLVSIFTDLVAVDAWRHIISFDGCYSFRERRGVPGKLSLHSWAAALDFNAERYPLGVEADPQDAYVREVVPVFVKHGWTWGGAFSRPDPMHFEATRGTR